MKKLTMLLCTIMLLVLAACSDKNSESGDKEKENSSNETRQITIQDAMDEQTIKGTPKKIVTLGWTYAENLLALGIQPTGVVDMDGFHKWVNIDKAFAENVTDVGSRQEPNLEAISRLNPDLIIAVKYRHEQILDKLKDIAPVVTFAPFGKKAEDDHFATMIHEFQLLAKIVDKEEKAEQLIKDLNGFMDKQKQRIADKGLEGSNYIVTQAFTVQNTPTLRLFTDNSIVAKLMSKLGLKNVYHSNKTEKYGYSEVSVEALVNYQKENLHFLYIVQNDDNIFENQLKHNPVWENLDFVKAGNTQKLPGNTWTYGGILSAEVLTEQLANAMLKN